MQMIINDLKLMLYEIKQRKKLTNDKLVIGTLSDETIKFLQDRKIPIHTKEIYITHKGLSHLSREHKKQRGAGLNEEDIITIPYIIKEPLALYFDDKKAKLNLIYCEKSSSCNKIIKIVIDTKGYYKKIGKITLVKTSGYIEKANLRGYIKIYGDIESR